MVFAVPLGKQIIMKISEFTLGKDGVFVIAEVGSNHEGDIIKAKEHIDAAKECGAQAVKFQSLNIKQLYKDPPKRIRELHAEIDFDERWYSDLKGYADNKGILFCSSPTYLESVRMLADIKVSFLKIASAQIGTFPQLIDTVAATGLPSIFSTGISNYEEITKAVAIFCSKQNENYAILHCNSQYPTPYENVHLGMIETYKKMFNCPVGFSDHTEGTSVVLAATALGADLIEKHFKIDNRCKSPDAPFSIDPSKFKNMVADIDNIKKACISSTRTFINSSEQAFKDEIRYKLILKNNKSEGDKFTTGDFYYLRTPGGIDVSKETFLLDTFKASQNLQKDSVLKWSGVTGA